MINSPRWPLINNVIRRNSPSNTFGMVRKRADGSPKPHQGWDFYASVGTPCYAIAEGTVVYADVKGDFGLIVVHSFQHERQTYYAAYAHLLNCAVHPRQAVARGDLIGACGKSGNAYDLPEADMHLHFEVRTKAMPGHGLAGRISPAKIYGVCPLKTPIVCPQLLPAKQISMGHGILHA